MRARLTTGFVMVCCALAIASAASAQATSPASPPVTVLKAHRLFDGRGDIDRQRVVVVQGGKITAVGADVAIPAGARVIDLGDVRSSRLHRRPHAHDLRELSRLERATRREASRTVAEKAIIAASYARKTLMAGFTTVRDVGSSDYLDVGLRNAINAGVTPGRACWSPSTRSARGAATATTPASRTCCSNTRPARTGIAVGPDGFRDAVRFR